MRSNDRPPSSRCTTPNSSNSSSSRARGRDYTGREAQASEWRGYPAGVGDASRSAPSMPPTDGPRPELRQALDESVRLLGGDGGLVYLRGGGTGGTGQWV